MNCSSRRWLNRLVVWLVKAKGFQQCGCPVCRSLESKLTVVERCLVPSIIATRVKKLAINKLAIDERMVVQNNSGSFLVRIPHELHDDTSICGTKNYTVGQATPRLSKRGWQLFAGIAAPALNATLTKVSKPLPGLVLASNAGHGLFSACVLRGKAPKSVWV